MPRTFPVLGQFVGRHKERALLRAAIEGKLRRKRDVSFTSVEVAQLERALGQPCIVLYFWGIGGIGKTRVLQEVDLLLKECEGRVSCRYGGFVDLYDTDLHDTRQFEDRLIAKLTRGRGGFKQYQTVRAEFDKLLSRGASARDINKKRDELLSAFVTDFNKLSAHTRPIICLDTVEILQYETTVVDEICGRLEGSVELQDWLIEVIPQLRNAVIILSARPQKDLEDTFRECFGASFISREVTGFVTLEETKEYFAAAKKNPDVAKALTGAKFDERVAHKYTGGQPLLLSMFIDLAVYQMNPPSYLSHSWEEAEGKTEDEVKEIREAIRRDLANKMLEWSGDLGSALPYLAWARKGVDLERLNMMLGKRGNRWQVLWEQLCNDKTRPSFVKIRPEIQLAFLHDEMYNLVDTHVANKDTVKAARKHVCDALIQYYNKRIKKSKGKQKQRLQVEGLYYEFLLDRYQGYLKFAEMADDAVIGHENEFAASLEIELLRSFPLRQPDSPVWAEAKGSDPGLTPDRLERGIAIRSVRRLLAEERYNEAVKAAEKLQQSKLHEPVKDPHFFWFLQAYKGEGMAYVMPGDPKTLQTLEETRKFFEENPQSKGSRGETLRLGALARTYNNLGYLYARQRRLSEAVQSYNKALDYYEKVNFPRQRAETLRNLADVFSRQGDLRRANDYAIQALHESEKTSFAKGVGLSLNVLARIELAREDPRAALDLAHRALRTLTQIEDVRDQGLAHITLGQAYRKIVGLETWTLERKDAEATLRRSLQHLDSAEDIFEKQISEPIRLVEVCAQRGCTLRDWATFYRQQEVDGTKIADLIQKAEHEFQTAIESARREKLIAEAADAMNDQAEIHYHGKDFDRTKRLLDESDKLISPGYTITTKGLPTPGGIPTSGFWQILGKNSIVRARIAFEEQKYELAMEQYLLAYLYFQKYSAKTPEFAVRDSVADELEGSLDRLPSPKAKRLEQLREFVNKRAEEYHVTGESATHQILAIVEAMRTKETE